MKMNLQKKKQAFKLHNSTTRQRQKNKDTFTNNYNMQKSNVVKKNRTFFSKKTIILAEPQFS